MVSSREVVYCVTLRPRQGKDAKAFHMEIGRRRKGDGCSTAAIPSAGKISLNTTGESLVFTLMDGMPLVAFVIVHARNIFLAILDYLW